MFAQGQSPRSVLLAAFNPASHPATPVKFTKKVSKPISVTTFMLQGMTAYDKHRGTDVIHMSDLTKTGNEAFCPREYALLSHLGKAKKGMPISAALRHTFDMGRDIEARVQNDYLGGSAVGHWTCASCGTVRHFCKRPKTGCEREDIRCNWRYTEVVVKHDGMVGGFDLCVDIGKPKLRLIELKTVIKEDFVKLEAPLAEHRLRTILYLYLVRQSAYKMNVDIEKASIIYISKSYGNWDKAKTTFSPFKEYDIRYDEATVESYLKLAAKFNAYLDTGKMPHGVCPTSQCKRASNCNMVQQCFSGKYKPGKVV